MVSCTICILPYGQVCHCLGITVTHTTSCHIQCNGLGKHFNWSCVELGDLFWFLSDIAHVRPLLTVSCISLCLTYPVCAPGGACLSSVLGWND